MKKEKIIKTHTRRTKSGKTVTVRQHRAKYDAAEEAKQLSKKIGAGKELEKKKKWVMDETERDIMDRFNSMEESEHPQTKHFLPPGKDHNTIRMKTIQALVSKYGKKASDMTDMQYISEYKKQKKAAGLSQQHSYLDHKTGKEVNTSLKTPQSKEKSTKSILNKKTPAKDAAVVERILKEKQELFNKAQELYNKANAQSKGSPVKNAKDTSTPTISASDFKAWYHWDAAGDPKNKTALAVAKKLRAKMGRSEYNKYFDEMSNSYSSRGHLKAYKALEPETAKAIKSNKMVAGTAEAQKEVAKLQGAKKAEKIFAAKEKEAKGNLNKLSGKGTNPNEKISPKVVGWEKKNGTEVAKYNTEEIRAEKRAEERIPDTKNSPKRRTTPNGNVSRQVKFKVKEGYNYKMPDGSILTYIGRNLHSSNWDVAKSRKGEHMFKDFNTGKIKFKDSDTLYALSERMNC